MADPMNPIEAIEAIEAAIVERLKERLPGGVTCIEAFPDNFGAFDLGPRDQAVFVHYSGSDFSPDGDTMRARYAPRDAMKFAVVLLVRNLRSANGGKLGCYRLLSDIRLALHGKSMKGSTPLVPTRSWLDGQKDGVWRWAIEFRTSVPAIAEPNLERDR